MKSSGDVAPAGKKRTKKIKIRSATKQKTEKQFRAPSALGNVFRRVVAENM